MSREKRNKIIDHIELLFNEYINSCSDIPEGYQQNHFNVFTGFLSDIKKINSEVSQDFCYGVEMFSGSPIKRHIKHKESVRGLL